jgi:hypothetical protein
MPDPTARLFKPLRSYSEELALAAVLVGHVVLSGWASRR